MLGYCPSPFVTLWILTFAPAFQKLAKQTIYSLGDCSQGIRLKDLWSNELSTLSLKFSWIDVYSELYDGRLPTAGSWGPAVLLNRCNKMFGYSTYNVTLRRVRATIVAVEKPSVSHSRSVCATNKNSWIKRDQLDVTCFCISLFNAQHVSDVNTSILRSLRLIWWVISWVVLFWFDVCWCYVVVWLG